jgi:quercetin dioxygenase-like cupin family protein
LENIIRQVEVAKESIGTGRSRYLCHTDNLMMVVIDFGDGPHSKPDLPHHHTHEQISYIVEGEIMVFIDGTPSQLGPGDMFTVPPNIPHTIQLLTSNARLVDTFTPLREDFLD